MLAFSRLSLVRGSRSLIDAFDLQVQAGTVVVVLGPNGVGKSSLLQALAGMLNASGEVAWQGESLFSMGRKQLAGVVAWQGELPPAEFGLTVKQRLQLAAGEEATAEVRDVARRMEVELLLQRDLAQLSSGERQRVEIAALALRDVPLWLMDEPTAHLDLKHQSLCLQLMREQAAAGRTIITVLHDLAQAQAVADTVVLLRGDGSAETGPASRVMTAPTLQALFGVNLKRSGSLIVPDYGSSAAE